MKLLPNTLFLVLMLNLPLGSQAALNVLACEPEWGALTRELGGDKVTVGDATTAMQDPHHVEARPSLISKARNANLLICTGADLEIGWLPLLLRQSANPAVQPGKLGNFEASTFVRMLEIPTRLDRSEGDIHPGGNPHIQTDPRNIAKVGIALTQRLTDIDPANAAYYQARQKDFAQRWQQAIQRWETRAAPLKGVAVVVQHKAFPYLSDWLGLHEVATLEPKPGVEPSSSHLAEVLAPLQLRPARMVIRAVYNDGRASAWLSEKAKIPTVVLPFTVGGADHADDLFGLFDITIDRLLVAIATDTSK